MKECVMGLDVGTGSARAGVFDLGGILHGYGAAPIRTWYPAPGFAEQSSEDIWRSACKAVREAFRHARLTRRDLLSISFDVTCSLVALDQDDKPLTVSPSGRNQQNGLAVW
jgi:ribulose kinase